MWRMSNRSVHLSMITCDDEPGVCVASNNSQSVSMKIRFAVVHSPQA